MSDEELPEIPEDAPDISEVISEEDRLSALQVMVAMAGEDNEYVDDEVEFLEGKSELLGFEEGAWEAFSDNDMGEDGVVKIVENISDARWARFTVPLAVQTALTDKDYDARERVLARTINYAAGGTAEEFLELERELGEPVWQGRKDGESPDEFQRRVGRTVGAISAVYAGIAGGGVGIGAGLYGAFAGVAMPGIGWIPWIVWAIAEFLGGESDGNDVPRPDQFSLEPVSSSGSFDVVAISGFLSQDADNVGAWEAIGDSFENPRSYALAWASATMPEPDDWPDGLVEAGQFAADMLGKWTQATDQTEKTGTELTKQLMKEHFGDRPVSLVGFSLGCDVIYEALSRMNPDELEQRIENVVLMGGAVRGSGTEWDRIAQSVAGDFVNVYSENDFVLSKVYSTVERETPIGLGEYPEGFDSSEIVEVDVSESVGSHLWYRSNLEDILGRVREEAKHV